MKYCKLFILSLMTNAAIGVHFSFAEDVSQKIKIEDPVRVTTIRVDKDHYDFLYELKVTNNSDKNLKDLTLKPNKEITGTTLQDKSIAIGDLKTGESKPANFSVRVNSSKDIDVENIIWKADATLATNSKTRGVSP
jgi:hypothetical protein